MECSNLIGAVRIEVPYDLPLLRSRVSLGCMRVRPSDEGQTIGARIVPISSIFSRDITVVANVPKLTPKIHRNRFHKTWQQNDNDFSIKTLGSNREKEPSSNVE